MRVGHSANATASRAVRDPLLELAETANAADEVDPLVGARIADA